MIILACFKIFFQVLRTGYFTDCTTSTTCYLNLTCTDGKCICPSSQGYNAVTKTCGNKFFLSYFAFNF